MRLASLVVEDALRVFEHLLPPQVKEVIRVRVEFEPVFSVIPVYIELVQWRGFVTVMVGICHCCWNSQLRDNLLIKNHIAFEGFAKVDVLQRDFLHSTIQLSDFDCKSIYPGL